MLLYIVKTIRKFTKNEKKLFGSTKNTFKSLVHPTRPDGYSMYIIHRNIYNCKYTGSKPDSVANGVDTSNFQV